MKIWKRLIHATASLRRLIRRVTRHVVRITIHHNTTVIPLTPPQPCPMPPLVPMVQQGFVPIGTFPICKLCGRHPVPFGDLCLGCRSLPGYLRKQNPASPAELLSIIHAYQDAAVNN